MSVFVDTGLFYAAHDERSGRHGTAREALATVLAGELGRPSTSDYVYDETITLTRSRTGSCDAARAVGKRILGRGSYGDVYDLLCVDQHVFETAIETFERYDDQSLSFTDATTVALVDRYDVDRVLSFDDDFDGVVDRLDPADG